MHRSRIVAFVALVPTLACGPGKSVNTAGDGVTETGSSGDGDGDSSESESGEPGEFESGEPGDGDPGDGDPGDGDPGETSDGTFIPDEGSHCSICDTFAQDCPEGEKCVPGPDLGGSCGPPSCLPIVDEQPPGESCSVANMADDCGESSWCYPALLDVEGPAICVEFCSGSIDAPQCSDPDEVCVTDAAIYGEPLGCRPRCNPLMPEGCLAGEVCTLGVDEQADFGCVIATAELAAGESCTHSQECAAGLCVETVELPDCADDRCCASYCDLLAPDCPAGTDCVAIELADNPELTAGVCMLPP